MKKILRYLLVTAVLSLLVGTMALSTSAATVDDISLTSVPTGRATQNATDHALNYQWFTVANNSAEAVLLNLSQSPDGAIFEVVSDSAGGLSPIGSAGAAAITLAGGETKTIALSAPGMRSASLWVTDSNGGTKSLAALGRYWIYYEYRDSGNSDPSTNLIATEQEAIAPGGSLSKVPPKSFQYNGDTYTPVSGNAQALSYNPSHTVANRILVFGYSPYVEGTYKIYMNCISSSNGALIGSPSVINVPAVTKNPDGTKNYPTVQVVPSQVISSKDVNGKVTVYRLDPSFSQGTRIHNYVDGEKTYTFKYVEDSAIPGKAYLISIRYIDKDTGLIIATQNETVIVNPNSVTTTTVQIPKDFTSVSARRYVLSAGQPNKITHLSNNTAQTVYNVYFELDKTLPTTDYDITLIYNDAATNTEVKRETITVPYLQGISFVADSRFDIVDSSGKKVTYTLAVGENRKITHNFPDTKRIYVINYNSNGSNLVPTSVIINYVENIKNGKMYTTTVNVPVNDVLVHTAPEKFDYNGKTYVMSSGQSRVISYNYGDIRTTYNFFYRYEGDADAGNPNTTPGNTIVDNTQNVVQQIGGNPNDLAEENVVINPNDNIDITDEYPDNTLTVPENEIPLAEGITKGNTSSFPWAWTIYGSIAVIFGVIIMIIIDKNQGRKAKRK
ncbi:MAG: hypothetical protein RSE43_04755 [Oscillospiraceae bacterium]